MSLDVYLIVPVPLVKKGTGIFVRESGRNKELSFEEVKQLYPEYISENVFETNNAYSDNITHNLSKMASEAGIYECLWKPKEIGLKKAKDLIEPLREGLHKLKTEPEKYKIFNPSNGWGNYEGLVQFVSNYLDACSKFPDADIEVSK